MSEVAQRVASRTTRARCVVLEVRCDASIKVHRHCARPIDEGALLALNGWDGSGAQPPWTVSDARTKHLRLVEPPAVDDSRAHLMSTIQDDVIPRLILAHLAPSIGAEWQDSTRIPPREEEVAELARIAALGDLAGALSFIERLLADGLSCESVLLNLVGPAARRLDDDWDSDARTFDNAMVGLETLEHVVGALLELISPRP